MKKWLTILFVIVLIAAGGGAWWWFNLRAQEPKAPTTVAVTRGDIEDTVLANGILEAKQLVSVGAQVSGEIKSLPVKLGQHVDEGDLIAEIDSLDQENDLKAAQASLADVKAQRVSQEAEVAKDENIVKRSKDLLERNLLSQSDYEADDATLKVAQATLDALDAQIEQAEIEVQSAQTDLDRTKIVAPISGTIVAVVVDQGQTVSASQSAPTIVKIADLDTMLIDAEISEADVINVEPGQEAHFTILGDPDTQIEATLTSIEPAPSSIEDDDDDGTDTTSDAIYYYGILEVPNPDHKLRISMTAQVTIVLNKAEDVLTLPSSALGHEGPDGRYMVMVYDPDSGQIHPQPVTVGLNNNVTAEIVDGLKEGDLVVSSTGGDSAAAAAAQGGDQPGGGPMGGPPGGGGMGGPPPGGGR